MNIKDAYVHVGPSGTNEKALLKDFEITADQITLTRAILNDAGTGDKTETITVPTWNNATNASKLSVIKSTAATTHYLTFVDSNNDSATNENFYTSTNLTVNPSTGALTTNGDLTLYAASGDSPRLIWLRSSLNLTELYDWSAIDSGGNLYFAISKGNGWENLFLFGSNGNFYVGSTAVSLNGHTHDDRYYTEIESDNRFVNVAGDTMTGALNLSHTDAITSEYANSTSYGINLGNVGHIGYSTSVGIYSTGNILLRPTLTDFANVNTNGLVISDTTFTYNTNKVWHEGNDGPDSGLNADLLDGQHLSDLDARYVLISGDTMTGALTVPSLSVTGAATFSQAINGSILGNAATASRLLNARTISLTGSVTGSGTFDGSGNLSITTSTNHNHNSVYMTACALFTGASAATSATASLTNGNVYLNATKTINGTATNVGSIKISGSTGISVTTDANGHISVTGTTSYLRTGASGATANVTSATSNPYLALVEGTTQSSQVQLLASTGISISANNGVITFTNTSTNSHTYTSTWTAKTDNVNYPIAFSPNATPATSGNGYNTGFTFNPGTKTFNNNGCRLQYDSTNKVLKFIFD